MPLGTFPDTMRIFFFSMMFLAVLACKSNQSKQEAAGKGAPVAQKIDTMPLIDLRTSPCRGFCPVFRLTFRQNGGVDYLGTRFVQIEGARHFSLTPTELQRLKSELAKTNLWQYPERFPQTVMDAPGATITIYKGAESKRIVGSIERPQPVLDIEELLKDLAEAHQIPVREGKDPNEIAADTRGEVLVQLKPEVNAGNWMRYFEGKKMRLLRRTGTENIWVIEYDKSEISENDLLTTMRALPEVLKAQPNREVKERKD